MVARLLETAGEIRRAARACIRRPSLSLAVLTTIALGLGAASAVLSVARAALLEPLPYRDAA